jgi:hypothetical protein
MLLIERPTLPKLVLTRLDIPALVLPMLARA